MAGGSDSLKERVSRIKNFLGTVSRDEAESMVAQMEDLNAKTAEIERILEELKALMEKVTDVLGDIYGLAEAIGGKLKEVESELSVVKLAVSGSASSHEGAMTTKIKVPRPKAYVGERSSKELENFLWDMEQYFKAAKVPNAERVHKQYLVGDAKLWWRTRAQEVLNGGRPAIEEWVVLKKELRAQFLPCNVAWLAREALKNLKQPWAQSELRKQDVRSLNSAIAAAERLMDYRAAVSSSGKKEQGGKRHLDTKGADKGNEAKVVQDGAKSGESKDKKTFAGCFLCQGPHRVKDCPRKQNLNAIVVKGDRGAEEGSSLQVSPIVLLNSLRVIPPEDPLVEDVLVQPLLEVIEVFVDVFAMEPSEVFIDASLLHGGSLWRELVYCTVTCIEISKAKEEPMEESEPWVESMAGIIVISSDDEDEPMEESEIEVIQVESSDVEYMGESNAKVV
ncbi:unnamed protein product, partial [Prunus brigantina]